MVNQKLRAARKLKRWSMSTASERVGVDRVTYSRWERGEQNPHLSTLDLLCQAYEMSPDELGFGHLVTVSGLQAQEEPEQFLDTPQNLSAFTREQLPALLALLKLGENIMFDPKKRETLQTLLTALTVAAVQPQGLLQPESWQHLLTAEAEVVKLNEATLKGFEKLMEACWQLSRGNELALAEKLLPECMTRLTPLAQQPSKHQPVAAHLAAQGFQLYSILALHRNDLPARELYCKQAVQYSLLSGDQTLLVVSLRQLADTYRYNNQHPQMLQTYLNALQHIERVSPLFQSCVHSGLAIAYAHIAQKQDALTYLGLANDAFPDHPETDPGFSFADFDSPWLILREGIIRSQLGELKQALDTFSHIEQPGIIIPERIRVEIINQQAKTALLSGDLEQGSSYVEAGVTGARLLGSQRRFNEAYDNYRQMALLWPQEKRVKALAELFQR